jgi:hypothetical protein
MESKKYLLEKDSNGNIDMSKFNFSRDIRSFDQAIKVIEVNLVRPLLLYITSDSKDSKFINNS